MLKADLLGKIAGERRVEVTRKLATSYAAAINDSSYDPEGPLAPPMLAYILSNEVIATSMQALMPEGLPSNAVHGEHDLIIDRPLTVGAELHVRVIPIGLARVRKGGLIAMRIESAGDDGSRWNTQTWTAFVPGWTPTWIGGEVPRLPDGTQESRPFRTVDFSTDLDQAARYDVLDYSNPIHTDDEFARSVGLPGLILQGTCTIALAGQAILAACGEGGPRQLRRLAARLARPVQPGDRLNARLWREGEFDIRFDVLGPARDAVLERGIVQLAPSLST